MNNAKIVVLAAGSFHGKSLVALHLAARMSFSGVITTDTIRNVLHLQNPDARHLSTSTYLLRDSDLVKQQIEVSGMLKDMIGLYRSRGEHIVVEGMHFSEDFLSGAHSQRFCNICIDNDLALEQRLILKTSTRTRFRLQDDKVGHIDNDNVHSSAYMARKERIMEIHRRLLVECIHNRFHIIRFSEINDCKNRVEDYVRRWFHGKSIPRSDL